MGAVVSDIDGISAKAVIRGLLQDKPGEELAQQARKRLKRKQQALIDSLEANARHRLLVAMGKDRFAVAVGVEVLKAAKSVSAAA